MVYKTRFHVRRFYCAGLISLTFIPILCIGYFFSEGKFQTFYSSEVVWFDKNALSEWKKFSGISKNFDFNHHRKYIEITLSGDQKADQVSFKHMEALIKHLATTKDTVNGMKVKFTTHTKYADLIRTIDLRSIFPDLYFLLLDDEAFFWEENHKLELRKTKLPPLFLQSASFFSR